MVTTTEDYALTTSDMDAMTDIISVQNITGMNMPAMTDASTAALASWIDEMTGGGWNTPVCRTISNPLLKSWMESLFEGLASMQTTYGGALFPEMYLANTYRSFVNNSDCMDCLPNNSFYQAFSAGASSILERVQSGDCSSYTIGPWPRPSVPASWKAAIDKAFIKWGTNGVPPVLANALNIYSASAWSPAETVKLYSYPFLSKLQEDAMADLRSNKQLDDSACIFLMYLLSAFPTSTYVDMVATQQIVQAPVTSYELGNDNFISHLIYYVLMCWVDPLGNYTLTGDQMKDKLNRLNGVLVSTDAATQTIKTSVQKYLKILTALPTYPMTDPYDTQDGFTTRQADILEALNSTWVNIA